MSGNRNHPQIKKHPVWSALIINELAIFILEVQL
jgi:hypothetical protein